LSEQTLKDLDHAFKNFFRRIKQPGEAPGKNVKAKAGLNKAILMQGWHRFQTLLTYKTQWHDGILLFVDPKYTSQQCSKCGHSEKENRKTQSNFSCKKCGYTENADLNAAKNILTVGLAGRACGAVA